MPALWITLSVATLGSLTTVLCHWINHHTATSRHRTWATVAADLPSGSLLSGTEQDSHTRVVIGAPNDPQENRGGR
jgi:hypothetical protein